MSRFGLIGTITSDHIVVEDRPPLRSLGGILYQAAVLCGLGEDVELFSNCGEELRAEIEAATAGWRTLRREGVVFVPGPGNQVHLRYSERLKEREEVLASAVPALAPEPVIAALPRLDMLLMVFNSGFELRLEDWRRIVAAERRAIWLDVHSLVLAKIVGSHRDYVAVPDWRDWVAGVSYLQANRQELSSLRGHPERWPSRAEIESFAGQAFDVGVRAVMVTLGKDGVLLLTPGARGAAGVGAIAGAGTAARPIVRHIQAPAADRVVDATGCGDVFCAAAMRLLARGASIAEAAEAGVVLASEAVGLAGITETFGLAASLCRPGQPGK
jgi:hypothetical protein